MMLVKVADRGEERGRPQLAAAFRARYLVARVVARGEANPIPTAYVTACAYDPDVDQILRRARLAAKVQ
jgi:hypothetical protein